MLVSVNIEAQVNTTAQKKAPTPKQSLSVTADSLKSSVNDAKNSFQTLFKGHRDTTIIKITDIEYEDSNLVVLKENLKKIKGVKSISMHYSESAVILKVPFKGKPTELWDELPFAAKAPFKLIEAGDNDLQLKFKNDKAAH